MAVLWAKIMHIVSNAPSGHRTPVACGVSGAARAPAVSARQFKATRRAVHPSIAEQSSRDLRIFLFPREYL